MRYQEKIYLDVAASAPLRAEARRAEAAYRDLPFAGANPNSLHSYGRLAARELDRARASLAQSLGGGFRPADVAFSGGGTEANNLGVLGIAEGVRARHRQRKRVILSAIEHDSILDLASPLKQRGFIVETIAPNRQGWVEPSALARRLDDDVALVSVMAANNETGIAQPIDELARVTHSCGASFFSDAIQAFCHLPLRLGEVDALSLAAHKLGAPPGVGALVIRHRTPFAPQSFGGGQEGGRRAGSQDVAGALAFAQVAATLMRDLPGAVATTSAQAQKLTDELVALPNVRATSDVPYDGTSRLPGIVSLCVESLESETLVLALDEAGFEVSAGSACSSSSLEPSHVLLAMGISRDLALGSLRVSFDERVDPAELSAFLDAFSQVVTGRRTC